MKKSSKAREEEVGVVFHHHATLVERFSSEQSTFYISADLMDSMHTSNYIEGYIVRILTSSAFWCLLVRPLLLPRSSCLSTLRAERHGP